jgi:hypothetical protein
VDLLAEHHQGTEIAQNRAGRRLGSWRKSFTSTSIPSRPGTASSSCRPVSAGTAPGLLEAPEAGLGAIAMVPPRVNTATRTGMAIA